MIESPMNCRGFGIARIVGMTEPAIEWHYRDPIHGDRCTWIWITGDYYVFLSLD